MTDPSPPEHPDAPRHLDDRGKLAWLRAAYFGLDGRWYLKLRGRTDPSFAQEVDEAVTSSLGRLHVRVWQELVGVEQIDDAITLGRFVQDVFDILYGDHRRAVRIVEADADRLCFQHVRCTIFDMGVAAGYDDDPRPGQLPGCRGVRVLLEGWAAEAGGFVVDQQPALDEQGRVACRYVLERSAPRSSCVDGATGHA